MQSVPAPVADNDEPFEPCPTPLSWKDVVREFRQQSDEWTATIEGSVVHGRTLGEGPPIYFVNGLLGDMDLMSLTVWVLREEHRCVLFDWPEDYRPKSTDSLTHLLTGIADQHGDKQFSVFSSGAGCIAAFGAMLKCPERLNKVVLQGAFAKCSTSFVERIAMSLGSLLPGKIGSFPGAIRILQQNHRPWFPPFDESRWSFAEENLAATSTKRIARMSSVFKQFDVSNELADLKTSTLLVRCEGDSPIQVKAQDELEATIPGVSTEWLHTCGRLPFLTHPHRLKKLLLGFLAN